MPDRMQTDEGLRRSYDSAAESYDRRTSSFAHRVHEHVTKANLLPVLRRCAPKTVLDAGGGTGKWTAYLAELGYKVILVDISPRSLDVARKRLAGLGGKVSIMEGNVETLDLPDESFDFVLSQGPMSYTPNPPRMLGEMHRVLRPDGMMWLDFYNAKGWASEAQDVAFKTELALSEEMLIQMPDWDYPARVFSLSRARSLCMEAGFSVDATFGNHVLLATLPLERAYAREFEDNELAAMQSAELRLSMDSTCVGLSKNCQFACRRSLR